MARITWDALGERRYELGVDRGVFYHYVANEYVDGVAWNGLTGVEDNIGGREKTPLYSGGVKAGSEYTAEEYSGKIKCYYYPDEFEEYLGEVEVISGIFARQQDRDMFAFCYRSKIGNDTEGSEHGYKLHLIYNMIVTDFSRSYSTINGSLDLQETEISFETFPEDVDDDEIDAVSELVLDSRLIDQNTHTTLENILYGTEEEAPRLPFPDEIIELFDVQEPLPPEWVLFPNFLVRPSSGIYPVSQED